MASRAEHAVASRGPWEARPSEREEAIGEWQLFDADGKLLADFSALLIPREMASVEPNARLAALAPTFRDLLVDVLEDHVGTDPSCSTATLQHIRSALREAGVAVTRA